METVTIPAQMTVAMFRALTQNWPEEMKVFGVGWALSTLQADYQAMLDAAQED